MSTPPLGLGDAAEEIARGARFAFGANWSRFLAVLSNERIVEAEDSLKRMLGVLDLNGKTFLDVGSGSGLFSLAARRLGATVTSFDYDPQSVACTQELRRRYFPEDAAWRVEQGSALDEDFMRRRGTFDVVYSWGVLHHTGDLWRGLANAAIPVAPGGLLFIAIYNDQGLRSAIWHRIKTLYCSGWVGKVIVCGALMPYFTLRSAVGDLLKGVNPLRRYLHPTTRGMSAFYDWFDWLGGLPFEVATPGVIVRFYRERSLTLESLVTVGGGWGNNEFVFRRSSGR